MSETIVAAGLLPSYLAAAFGELYEEDGIAIFGRGLGILNLLACFVRFYADVKEGHVSVMQTPNDETNNLKKPPLVLVLGLRDSEFDALISILQTWGTPAEMLPTLITNEAGQGENRSGTCGDLFLPR